MSVYNIRRKEKLRSIAVHGPMACFFIKHESETYRSTYRPNRPPSRNKSLSFFALPLTTQSMRTMLNSYVSPRQGGCLAYNNQEPNYRSKSCNIITIYINMTKLTNYRVIICWHAIMYLVGNVRNTTCCSASKD